MAIVQRKGPDTLDKTVTYLAKRDGIDKASAGNAWECVGVGDTQCPPQFISV